MRVYYDDTIIQAFRCEIECQKDEYNNLIDVVDFCHVDKLPISINRNKKSICVDLKQKKG